VRRLPLRTGCARYSLASLQLDGRSATLIRRPVYGLGSDTATHPSRQTIRNHVSNIFTKLHVADRAQAVVRAREVGLGQRWCCLMIAVLRESANHGSAN
jgi:Bacterial regulatory proteins, luxR family